MGIGRNTIANIIGAFLPLLVTVLTVPLYLTLIGEERYGTLVVIWALFGYFGFFDFGLGRATAREMARLSENPEVERTNLLFTTIILTLIMGALGGVVLWGVAGFIISRFIDLQSQSSAEALAAIPWLVFGLPLLLMTSVMAGALEGRERFFELNKVNVLGSVLNQCLPLLVAVNGFVRMEYLVPAAILGRILTGVILLRYCNIFVPLTSNKVSFNKKLVKPLLNYGGWTSLISAVGPLLVTVDRVIIGSVSGAKAVAYYTVPYNFSFNLIRISGSLSSALFPRLSAVKHDEGLELANQATQILVAVMSPLVITGFFAFRPFMIVWLGSDFADNAFGVGEVIFWGIWINCLVMPHNARLRAAGNLRPIFFAYLFQIPVYLLMLVFGLKYFGVLGAAVAWSLRVTIDTLMLLWIGNVLLKTVMRNIFIAFVVTISLVYCFLLSSDTALYWGGYLFFMAMVVFISKSQLELVFRKIITKRI